MWTALGLSPWYLVLVVMVSSFLLLNEAALAQALAVLFFRPERYVSWWFDYKHECLSTLQVVATHFLVTLFLIHIVFDFRLMR